MRIIHPRWYRPTPLAHGIICPRNLNHASLRYIIQVLQLNQILYAILGDIEAILWDSVCRMYCMGSVWSSSKRMLVTLVFIVASQACSRIKHPRGCVLVWHVNDVPFIPRIPFGKINQARTGVRAWLILPKMKIYLHSVFRRSYFIQHLEFIAFRIIED